MTTTIKQNKKIGKGLNGSKVKGALTEIMQKKHGSKGRARCDYLHLPKKYGDNYSFFSKELDSMDLLFEKNPEKYALLEEEFKKSYILHNLLKLDNSSFISFLSDKKKIEQTVFFMKQIIEKLGNLYGSLTDYSFDILLTVKYNYMKGPVYLKNISSFIDIMKKKDKQSIDFLFSVYKDQDFIDQSLINNLIYVSEFSVQQDLQSYVKKFLKSLSDETRFSFLRDIDAINGFFDLMIYLKQFDQDVLQVQNPLLMLAKSNAFDKSLFEFNSSANFKYMIEKIFEDDLLIENIWKLQNLFENHIFSMDFFSSKENMDNLLSRLPYDFDADIFLSADVRFRRF